MGLVSEQSIYNLIVRNVELEVLPAAEAYGLGVIPWSPLQGGLLGGVVRRQRTAAGAMPAGRPTPSRATRPQLEAYEDLCEELGEDPGDRRAGLAADPTGGDRADHRAAYAPSSSTSALHAVEVSLDDTALEPSGRDLPGPPDGPRGLRLVS